MIFKAPNHLNYYGEMKINRLERTQMFPVSIGEAWDFFSNPRNLPLITPPDLHFEITSPIPAKIHEGLIISYNIKPLFHISVTWVAEISHTWEPFYFVDRQICGPYKLWHHAHHFREMDNGTEMTDLVHYILPFWKLGELANQAIVRRELDRIFDFRRRYLENKFGTIKISPGP